MNYKSTCNHDTGSIQTSNTTDSSVKWVAIRNDSLKTIREIAERISDEKIPHQINLAPGCKNGSCALTYILVVPEEQTHKGHQIIENYFLELHPEFQISKDLEEQGKCPACGFANIENSKTCSDCGLQLIMEY